MLNCFALAMRSHQTRRAECLGVFGGAGQADAEFLCWAGRSGEPIRLLQRLCTGVEFPFPM